MPVGIRFLCLVTGFLEMEAAIFPRRNSKAAAEDRGEKGRALITALVGDLIDQQFRVPEQQGGVIHAQIAQDRGKIFPSGREEARKIAGVQMELFRHAFPGDRRTEIFLQILADPLIVARRFPFRGRGVLLQAGQRQAEQSACQIRHGATGVAVSALFRQAVQQVADGVGWGQL